MNTKLKLILLASTLCACSVPDSSLKKLQPPPTMNLMKTTDQGQTAAALADADRRKLEDALSDVLTYCQPRLSGFERDSANKAKQAFWLSMSGLVAGSVLAPALTATSAASNAAWISALSGWAGATNFAGQTLKTSGLSGTTIAQTRNAIIADLRTQIEVATDGNKTFEERRNALMKARASCTVYEIAVPSIPDPG